MKAVTIVATATLVLSAHAASAQMYSTTPGTAEVTINSEAHSARAQATHPRHMRRIAPVERSTTGSGYYEHLIPGETGASNPNPSWNRNPDPEVPGSTLE